MQYSLDDLLSKLQTCRYFFDIRYLLDKFTLMFWFATYITTYAAIQSGRYSVNRNTTAEVTSPQLYDYRCAYAHGDSISDMDALYNSILRDFKITDITDAMRDEIIPVFDRLHKI